MPIDQLWNTLTASDWDAFARAWLAELRGESSDDSDMGQRVVLMSFTSTAEHQWSFINAAIRHAKTDDELGHIAAGPIEHLLSKHGDSYIGRVEEMAASNPLFKKMLLGVWKHMMNDTVWERVQAIQDRLGAGRQDESPIRRTMMARKKNKGYLVLVHWDAAEAEELAAPLRAEGWQVKTGSFELKDLKADPPVAVLISLRRLPSHGREVADALWYAKWGRAVPIVFFDGASDKVAATRKKFPAAQFATWEQLPGLVRQLEGAEEAA